MSKGQTFSLPSSRRRSYLAKATSEYAECVDVGSSGLPPGDRTARTYLQGRGLTDEVIDRWKLGYVLDPLPGHERFKGYLSIPYLTKAGTTAMKFRCIADHECKDASHPKYDGEKGQGTYLFGSLSFWRQTSFVCVVEGELDAISCDVAGLSAVGIPGGNNWKSHWSYCFEGFEEVIALQDGFKEGDKARDRFASNVGQNIHNSRVIEFGPGEDANSFLVQHGPSALRAKVLGHE